MESKSEGESTVNVVISRLKIMVTKVDLKKEFLILEPIWPLLFFMKNQDFQKILKIHENHWFSIDFGLYISSRVADRCLLVRSEMSPRSGGSGPPGAVGVPESPIMLGMVIVMPIQVFMAIGGPQIDFSILDSKI